jgi:hypothetical protein
MNMRLVIILILVTVILSQGYVAHAQSSEAAQQRIQYAAKLQEFFNSLADGVKTKVSAEGTDSSRLRIVRSGVFRGQFVSLFRPFLGELESLGFRSFVLCAPGPVCQKTCVSRDFCRAID